MHTYFASDGTYGNAEDIVICDTSDWTEAQWYSIKLARPDERHIVAEEIIKIKQRRTSAASGVTYIHRDVRSNQLDVYDKEQLIELVQGLQANVDRLESLQEHGYNGA